MDFYPSQYSLALFWFCLTAIPSGLFTCMGFLINTAICTNFYSPSAFSYSATVTDNFGSSQSRYVFTGSANTYHRFLLAKSGSSNGSEEYPYEVLRLIQNGLNVSGSQWQCGWNSNGRINIRYVATGSTSGSINFGTMHIPALLGLATSSYSNLTNGSYITGSYSPAFCFFTFARVDDTGWQRMASHNAVAQVPNGKQIYFGNTYQNMLRKFTTRFHPTTLAEALSQSNPANLFYPNEKGYYNQPNCDFTSVTSPVTPFSLMHFIYHAPGQQLGATWGKFQNIISGTWNEFEIIAPTDEFVNHSPDAWKRSSPNDDRLGDFSGMSFMFVSASYL